MSEAESKQRDLTKQLEAILFASGRKMSVEEISRLCRTTVAAVQQHLQELKSDYELKDSSLLLMDESDGWKLTVREQYTPVVQKIVADTELTKTMIETLAVIAWKAPVLQASVIKIRTNKAYDHIAALDKSGFIAREKHGRSQMIKLTERFFKYFDLKSQEEVKEKFKGLAERQETLPAMAENAAPETIETQDGKPVGAAGKDVPS
ncbi:MAG TPA: SMC-Scp complex subunit ScpB [Candidatus Nanoarchaeia archaeon]|nr:SMC-Scp complex subunit ScpB [Candidatus Nanoarchaeia archaeon]